jgi:hypothetical protein
MNSPAQIGLRVGFIAIALVLWFWTQRLISQKAAPAGGAIGDRLHDWTAPLLEWLTAHPAAANLTLIITSALVDAFGLYLFGRAIFGPTLQPFIALLIVFVLRQSCQATVTLPTPPGILWRHPGFPSLLVTYGVSNDFFFSGHTAMAVLGALQLFHAGPPWLAALGAMVAVVEAFTVIVLRAHYTMDVFAAVFAAWAADVAARHLAPMVDVWLAQLF